MWTLWFVPGEKMSLGTAALLECANQEDAEAQCRQPRAGP